MVAFIGSFMKVSGKKNEQTFEGDIILWCAHWKKLKTILERFKWKLYCSLYWIPSAIDGSGWSIFKRRTYDHLFRNRQNIQSVLLGQCFYTVTSCCNLWWCLVSKADGLLISDNLLLRFPPVICIVHVKCYHTNHNLKRILCAFDTSTKHTLHVSVYRFAINWNCSVSNGEFQGLSNFFTVNSLVRISTIWETISVVLCLPSAKTIDYSLFCWIF